jgi:hypothetical protein
VASLPDFIIMKAHALAGRDKPKDAYDICYCLTNFPGGMDALAAAWKQRAQEKDVLRAIEILERNLRPSTDLAPGKSSSFLIWSNAKHKRCKLDGPLSWCRNF